MILKYFEIFFILATSMLESEHTGSEKDLTRQTLQHSLFYRKDSGLVFLGKVMYVKGKVAERQDLYPPEFIAIPGVHRRERIKDGLPTQPFSPRIGRVSPAEAVALSYLHDESDALFQLLDPVTELDLHAEMAQALGVPNDDVQQNEAILGMNQFGFHVGIAAGVRDRLLRGEAYPDDPRTLQQMSTKTWWDHFAQPLRDDALMIGQNTGSAIVDYLDAVGEVSIPRSGVPKPKETIIASIVSRKHGIRLARNLYEEAFALASDFLPTTHP